jgi:hypothetical protein
MLDQSELYQPMYLPHLTFTSQYLRVTRRLKEQYGHRDCF